MRSARAVERPAGPVEGPEGAPEETLGFEQIGGHVIVARVAGHPLGDGVELHGELLDGGGEGRELGGVSGHGAGLADQ